MNKLFILSGQSGVGKNTILKAVLKKHPDFFKPVTYTTREQRPKEIPGQDHYFTDRDKFKEMIDKGEFIEWARVHSELYGTPREQISKALKSGKSIIMEIDVQGAIKIKKVIQQTVLIFIKYEPGNLEQHIRHRIKRDASRGNVSEEEIQTRIRTARQELSYEKLYDYSVVNPEGNPQKAIREVEKIINHEIV